jgi:hypothetical protein
MALKNPVKKGNCTDPDTVNGQRGLIFDKNRNSGEIISDFYANCNDFTGNLRKYTKKPPVDARRRRKSVRFPRATYHRRQKELILYGIQNLYTNASFIWELI